VGLGSEGEFLSSKLEKRYLRRPVLFRFYFLHPGAAGGRFCNMPLSKFSTLCRGSSAPLTVGDACWLGCLHESHEADLVLCCTAFVIGLLV